MHFKIITNHSNKSSRMISGFSLIELSIILMIIGLLVASIVGGTTLMRAARTQRLMHDFDEYRVAYNTFIEKYNAKPGDFIQGYVYFANGGSTNCGPNNSPAANTSSGKGCNGDGDGIIDHAGSGLIFEGQLAWLHLQLAGIINDKVKFIGTTSIGSPMVHLHTVPVTKADSESAGWAFGYYEATWYMGESLTLGQNKAGAAGSNQFFTGPALKPLSAQLLDKKMDDGLPANGRIRADISSTLFASPYTQCHSGGNTLYNSSSYTYKLKYKDPSCAMIFLIDKFNQ